MALGGGTFTAQNKELPGAYINFVSAASASAASAGCFCAAGTAAFSAEGADNAGNDIAERPQDQPGQNEVQQCQQHDGNPLSKQQ